MHSFVRSAKESSRYGWLASLGRETQLKTSEMSRNPSRFLRALGADRARSRHGAAAYPEKRRPSSAPGCYLFVSMGDGQDPGFAAVGTGDHEACRENLLRESGGNGNGGNAIYLECKIAFPAAAQQIVLGIVRRLTLAKFVAFIDRSRDVTHGSMTRPVSVKSSSMVLRSRSGFARARV
jgi:hypothetical protein